MQPARRAVCVDRRGVVVLAWCSVAPYRISPKRLLPLAPAPPMVVAGPAWDRLTAGQMFPLCSYGEQMENRSANVAGGVRRSVSRPGGVRPLPRREAVAGWFCLPRLRRLQGLGA